MTQTNITTNDPNAPPAALPTWSSETRTNENTMATSHSQSLDYLGHAAAVALETNRRTIHHLWRSTVANQGIPAAPNSISAEENIADNADNAHEIDSDIVDETISRNADEASPSVVFGLCHH
ncbi:hypothetical protein IW261DRAFT_1564405 [Armillaria novae-zelandiae]|uniref:Uncharacterized protein n=1 Tax=Armillaria novae-zelandiae TaxID=153914 RepID=A0AA39P9F9_9AGAR|nr:hypothetical protein IW261DRAFT_1564405 [Armillaria novae-zelandiae]